VIRDGTKVTFGPNDVFAIPPGHDGYTLADEPCVQIEWSGLRTFAGFRLGEVYNRSLATLWFTGLVDSTLSRTASATSRGGICRRRTLRRHRAELERHHDTKSRRRETGCSPRSTDRWLHSNPDLRPSPARLTRTFQ
jgi:hypothetical protein